MKKDIYFCIHGASSLIGKNFCKYLISHGYSFTIFAREKSDLGFLNNYEKVKIYRYKFYLSELFEQVPKIEGSIFIELSWYGVFGTEKNNPEQYTFNIPQTIHSLHLSKELGAKHWIGFGSQAEYGNISGKVDEMAKCNPKTLYGKAKLACSDISSELCNVYGIKHSWLRLFTAYGPYGNHKWFVDYLIEEMKNNRTIDVTECEQYLDFLYVDDISSLLIKLSTSDGVGIANLGSGKAVKLKDIIEKIRTILNSKSKINYGALNYKEDQGMFNEADISKLSNISGWIPKTSIDEGLSDMIKKMNKEYNFKEFAKEVRKLVLKIIYVTKSSHIGSVLSMVDILAVIYNGVLRIDPLEPKKTDRDIFLLSKGHACVGLYVTLALKGFFPLEYLDTFTKNDSLLLSHASYKVPGVELSTGSLGHALSVGAGLAYSFKKRKNDRKVYVLLSDGELDEGSNWEAIMFAGHHNLNNLIAIIDYNKIQSFGTIKEVLDLGSIKDKFESFGWRVTQIDGHNHEQINTSLNLSKIESIKPIVLIADTIKGKGIDFMENQLVWHYKSPSDEQYKEALNQIEKQ